MSRPRAIRSGALAGVLLLALAGPARADQGSVRIDWRQSPPSSGEVVDGAARVQASAGGTFPLTSIASPPVGLPGYALVGRVRYDGVEGAGFLEMWSVFPDGGRYFSRTLAQAGPLAQISGDSGWRRFELPFELKGADRPVRLDMDVVLPGSGTVFVGPLGLVALDTISTSEGWWSSRTAGLIGGIGGSAVGVFGAAIGALVSRRRARRLVIRAIAGAVLVGVVLVAVAAAAILSSKPYAVWFPLLLMGALMTAIFGSAGRAARRAYEEAELRRMRAIDLG